MKDNMTTLKTIAMLLLLGVALSGCVSTGRPQMMDDSMATTPMAKEMDNMEPMENARTNSDMMDIMK